MRGIGPVESAAWPHLDPSPNCDDALPTPVGVIAARSDATLVLGNRANLHKVCHDFYTGSPAGSGSAGNNRNRSHATPVTAQDVFQEISDDKVRLARAAIDDTALQHRAAAIPFDVNSTAPVWLGATDLHLAGSAARLLLVHDLQQVTLQPSIIGNSLPQARSFCAVDLN